MAKLEVQVFDKKGERDSLASYEIVTSCLESHPEKYERGTRQEGNDGYFSNYRDGHTTSMMCIEGNGSGDKSSYITLVGNEDKMDLTIQGIRDVIPKIMVLEKISGDGK